MLTHRNIYANSMQGMYAFGLQGKLLKGAVTVLLGLPFFHTYGHSVMHNMTLFGLQPDTGPRSPGHGRHDQDDQGALSPHAVRRADPVHETLRGAGRVRACSGVSGSAALPTNVQDKFESKAGGGILEGYGLSEMSPTTHLNTSFLARLFGGRTVMRINTMHHELPGQSCRY